MDDNTSANKRIAKNAIFLYLRMAIVLIVNLYTTRLILNNLGADDYGIYNVVYGFVTMFTVFNVTLTAGINRYYNYELGKDGFEGVRKVYNVALRIQSICAIIILVVVEIIGVLYVNDHMVMDPSRVSSANWVLQFSVISMVLLIMQNPFSSAVMAFEKMDFYAVISIVDVILKMIIAIGIAYSPVDKLVYYGFFMSIISVINFLSFYFYCKIKFTNCMKVSKTYDHRLFKDMLKFSGWMILDPIAFSINGQGVNMLLNSFFGTLVNTAFGIANQVGQAIDSFCMNLSTAFRPQMIQSYSTGNIGRSLRLFSSMSKFCFILFLLICIPIVFNIKYIYTIWLGNSFPPITIPISIIFIFVKLVGCLNHPISYIIMAKGNLKRYMLVTSIITSSIIPLSFIFLRFGCSVEVVFVSMLFISVINQIASIIVLSREIPEYSPKDYCKTILWPCIELSLLLVFSVAAIHRLLCNDTLRLVFDFIVSGIITLSGSYLFCMDSSEKELLKIVIKRIKIKAND